jgi:sigma-E factor negative regulatory protein RseA
MNQEISSLVDSELDEQEAGRAIKACCGSDELKRTWLAYHMIGEVMRGEGASQRTSTARILAALDREPTVLAPGRSAGRAGEGALRVAFAVAASVATVSVVAWVGLQGRPDAAPASVAKAPAQEAQSLLASTAVPRSAGMPIAVNDYLTVHRQVPSPEAYLTVANQQRAAGKR